MNSHDVPNDQTLNELHMRVISKFCRVGSIHRSVVEIGIRLSTSLKTAMTDAIS